MMNAITLAPGRHPTPEEPVPSIAGTHGLTLLRSAAANRLLETVTEEDRPVLLEAARVVCASLTPARVEEVAVSIEALALHYPSFNRTRAESVVANGHWAEDLDGWPADLIAEACRQWRNSSERFFPTPGQLKAKAQSIMDHREVLAKRARDVLVGLEGEAA